jgi:hypothetical protein
VYATTLNELKIAMKVSAQAEQSDAVNNTSVQSTTQDDDFQKVKRCKRHISNNTSRTAKKSNNPVSVTPVVKLPTKSVLTCNFFAPLRIKDKNTETTRAQNSLPEQEAPRKPDKPPPIVMTSTTNLIRLQVT